MRKFGYFISKGLGKVWWRHKTVDCDPMAICRL